MSLIHVHTDALRSIRIIPVALDDVVSAGADWIGVRPEILPPGRRIYHELTAGNLDLQIDGAADQVEAIRNHISFSARAPA